MSKYVSSINPGILKWARERTGYTLEDVSKILKKDTSIIESWESGEKYPTYVQLERLAYKLYKRPMALFFFPAPPEETDPRQSFRTLPDFEINNLSSDSRFAIRQAKFMQLALHELNDGANPSEKKIFRDIQINVNSNLFQAVNQIRNYLGIDFQDQIQWDNHIVALKNWRTILEEKGIYVFKRSFKQGDISGFCLLDKEFPIIYLNNSTSTTRQIFTLFHELSHILLGTNGITFRNDNYISVLSGDEKKVEVYCNKFSAEFLVPSLDFDKQLESFTLNDEYIQEIAHRYKVSREVILRKLLDKKIVNTYYYRKKTEEWTKEYEEFSKLGSGGNYYATQATYLGEKFLNLAFRNYYQGRIPIEQLADYLNVKVKSVAGIERFLFRKSVAI